MKLHEREQDLQSKLREAQARAKAIQAEIDRLHVENANLSMDLERHRKMRIDVNSYRTVLKLGVLESDVSRQVLCRRTLADEKAGPINPVRDERVEFLGVYELAYKALLGVDLNALKFRNAPDGRLIVSGIKSEFQGTRDFKDDWLLKEVRRNKNGRWYMPDTHEILEKDHRIADQILNFARETRERINRGMEDKQMDRQVRQQTLDFLRAILSPLGKPVEFWEVDDKAELGLMDYVEQSNHLIDQSVRDLERRRENVQAEIESKRLLLSPPPTSRADDAGQPF